MNREAEILFHDLADLSPAERDLYFLQRQVPQSLRAEVEELLSFDSGAGHSLTGCALNAAGDWLRTGPDGREGTHCGPYRLVRLLGRGGMGAVYLAERDDGEVRQTAAIKLLRFGGDDPAFRERFLRERQIVASLSHPGIARLLDAGHTPDGHPYLALEHIDGLPIDRFAERLDVRAIVALLLPVCDAVSCAHRHLVVHRDLKPSNILVDAGGQPKLLDFGIAKLLDQADDVTQTRERLLTPAYASPEQVAGAAQSTAGDIYSLGAVLYKLLTGRTPRETASERPSRLNPRVPRDLDFVVLKALRAEPDERYPSADALASDLRAVLEWRPVRARAGTAWYRTRRFLRRYRIPAAAALLALVSLALGFYVANRERVIAQRRFAQVRQMANRFLQLDEELRLLPGSTKARQRVVTTSLQYLEPLGREARGDRDLALEIGTAYLQVGRVLGVPAYSNLGELGPAEDALRKADALVASAVAAAPRDRVALLRSAEIARDRMIVADTEHRDADSLTHANEAAARLDSLARLGPPTAAEAPTVARIYHNIALAQSNLHRYQDAVAYARRSIAITRAAGSAPLLLSPALSMLANALRSLGDLDGALAAIRESRAVLASAPPADPQQRLFAEYNSIWREGVILGEEGDVNLGRPDEAIPLFRRALQIADEAAAADPLDSASRSRVGESARELAMLLLHRDPRESLAVFDRGLARLREIHDNTKARRDEIYLLTGSAPALLALHRERDARQRIDEATRLARGLHEYPGGVPAPGSISENILRARAAFAAATGDLQTAADIYVDLITRLQSNWQTDLRHANTVGGLYGGLAAIYRRMGRAAGAAAFEQRRLDLWHYWERKLPRNAFILKQLTS